MLRIRFSRTGKKRQPSFRIVVAERTAPVKGRFIDIVGNYMPARTPKVTTLNKERITHWLSKGAVPSDSVAALLKKEGVGEMEKYLEPRNKKRRQKGEQVEAAKTPVAAQPVAAAVAAK